MRLWDFLLKIVTHKRFEIKSSLSNKNTLYIIYSYLLYKLDFTPMKMNKSEFHYSYVFARSAEIMNIELTINGSIFMRQIN